MIQNYINWGKNQIDWWLEKRHFRSWSCLDIIIKGILVGLLVYFFIVCH